MANDNTDVKAMLEAINRAISDPSDEFSLNEKEEDFVKNMTGLAEKGYSLSERRDAWLTSIWKRATGM